jgi:glycosyltransferase involved in cell wall biosynthesis
MKDADFPIRYFYQPHGHKKTAYNRAVREANGEFLLCWDSDDAAFPDTLQTLYDAWRTIPEADRDGFVGVTGLCAFKDGTIFGDPFPDSPFDSTPLELALCYRVKGDKSGFQRIEVLRQFPFPEFIDGLVPEGVVWNAIGRQYLTRYINTAVLIYHVEPDSIINSPPTKEKMRSMAAGRALAAADVLTCDCRFIFRAPIGIIKIAANHTRYHLHMRRLGVENRFPLGGLAGRILKIAAWPIGFAAFLYDERMSGKA